MLIGEISKRTDLSRDTIRFYEKIGLIKPEKAANPGNTYKEYTEEIVMRLQLIKHVKSLGFTLNEISDVLELIGRNAASCETVSGKMSEKITTIDNKISELMALKKSLSKLLVDCCQPSDVGTNCPMIIAVPQK